MSVVKGKKREIKESSQKFVGLGEFEVIAVNPDREELEEMGFKVDKDPEYLGEDKDGEGYVRIAFYVKEKTTGYVGNVSYFLKNKKLVYETKEGEVKGSLWINDKCSTTFLAKGKTESDLPSWFVKDAEVRECLEGEDRLYNFLKTWIQIDFWDKENNCMDKEASMVFDTKKLLRGNVKDLKNFVDDELTRVVIDKKTGDVGPATLLLLCTVKTKQDGTEVPIINGDYVIPGYNYQEFKGKKFTKKDFKDVIALLEKKEKEKEDWAALKKFRPWQKFAGEILKSQYGVKEFFGNYLGTIREYDPAENVAAGDQPLVEAEEDGPGYERGL